MFKYDAGTESDHSIIFAFDGQIELSLFGFGSGLENGDVGSLLFAFIFDHGFMQLIVNLEVARWQDLENGIAVIFKVQ